MPARVRLQGYTRDGTPVGNVITADFLLAGEAPAPGPGQPPQPGARGFQWPSTWPAENTTLPEATAADVSRLFSYLDSLGNSSPASADAPRTVNVRQAMGFNGPRHWPYLFWLQFPKYSWFELEFAGDIIGGLGSGTEPGGSNGLLTIGSQVQCFAVTGARFHESHDDTGNASGIAPITGSLRLKDMVFYRCQTAWLASQLNEITIENVLIDECGHDKETEGGSSNGHGAYTYTNWLSARHLTSRRNKTHQFKCGAGVTVLEDSVIEGFDGQNADSLELFYSGHAVLINTRVTSRGSYTPISVNEGNIPVTFTNRLPREWRPNELHLINCEIEDDKGTGPVDIGRGLTKVVPLSSTYNGAAL